MKSFFWLFIIVCVFASIVALTNEIVQFSILEFKFKTNLTFGKNDKLLTFPQQYVPKLCTYYDINYQYAHIPEYNQLGEWCSNIIDEVFTVCKQKYPVIMSIHYFKKVDKNLHFATCSITNFKNYKNSTIVIVPLTNQKCEIDKSIFINNICIISHITSEIKINIERFLLVRTQKCKAWDL